MDKFQKLQISLRYWLLGKEYFSAVEALEFAASYHTGMRKDGVTPEFQHQIEISHYLRTLLPSFQYPEETITAALLHDVSEDYAVPIDEIRKKFGNMVADAVFLLDKTGKTTEHYFEGIAQNPIASIVKGGDRIHNLQSMIGVFTAEKQARYASEVDQHFLPMLKTARRLFPRQEAAYENIKHMLESQVELVQFLLKDYVVNQVVSQ